jgi:hypothetical protein
MVEGSVFGLAFTVEGLVSGLAFALEGLVQRLNPRCVPRYSDDANVGRSASPHSVACPAFSV